MGGKIDKSLYVDADGKRIYVCCQGCAGAVKKNPAKYLKALEAKGEKVAQLQTTCPVMGGKIDKSLYVDADGKRIYVCCQGCVGTIKADPAKYIKALEAKGVTLDATPHE
jgi:YHS domain-containing protein